MTKFFLLDICVWFPFFWLKIPSLYWLWIVCSVKEQKQCLDLCIFSFVHNVKLKGRIRERVNVTIKMDYPFWFRRAFYRHFPKSYRHCLKIWLEVSSTKPFIHVGKTLGNGGDSNKNLYRRLLIRISNKGKNFNFKILLR